MQVAHGSVEWLTSTAATGTYSQGDVGFTIKALIFWWTGIASAGSDAATEAVDMRRGIGFATSTSARRCVASYDDDGVGTSDCSTAVYDDCIAATHSNAAARDGALDITAMGTGFTLTVDDQLPTGNITLNWLALGGDDITVAVVGNFTEPASATTVDVTATGLTSDGANQVVFVAGAQATAAINSISAENGGISFGVATGTGASEQWCVAGSTDHASTATDTDGIGGTGKVVAQAPLASGTAFVIASLSAWGTDQFTVSYSGTVVSGRKNAFLAIKGGSWSAGSYTIEGNSASATADVTALPLALKGIIVAGRMVAAQNASTGSTNDRIGIGWGTGTSARLTQGVLNENGTASSNVEVDQVAEFDAVLAFPSTAGALQSAYDINAFGANSFEIIVDTAGGVTSEWQGYLAMGDTPGVLASDGEGEPLFAGTALTPGVFASDGEGALSGIPPSIEVTFAQFEIPDAGDIEQGALASDGEGELLFVGASRAEALFASEAEAEALLVGASSAAGVLAADGEGDFTAASAANAPTTFTADGEGEALLVGASIAAGVLASDGEADLAFASAGTSAGVFASDGEGEFLAVGSGLIQAVFSADGEGEAAFAGGTSITVTFAQFEIPDAADIESGAFGSDGESELAFIGQSASAGALNADGEAEAPFLSASISAAVLNADGEAEAAFTGASSATGVLNADGEGALSFVSNVPGASWLEAVDTDHTALVLGSDEQLRLRIAITNNGTADVGTGFKWQYAKNAGAWTDLTAASSNIRTYDSTEFADGDDIPQILTAGDYLEDNNAAEEATGAFTMSAGLAADESFETEIALELVAADLAGGDYIDLRVVRSDGTPLDAYDVTPRIYIDDGTASTSFLMDGEGEMLAIGAAMATGVYASDAEAELQAVGASLAEGAFASDGEADFAAVGFTSAQGAFSTEGEAAADLIGQAIAEGVLAIDAEATAEFEATDSGLEVEDDTSSIQWRKTWARDHAKAKRMLREEDQALIEALKRLAPSIMQFRRRQD